jgi:hypothetical protein
VPELRGMEPDPRLLALSRHQRLLEVMEAQGAPAILTANPINILYATGVRNMTVFSLMGPFRFALVLSSGEVILWEFAGCEHLVAGNPVVTEVRPAPGISAIWGEGFAADAARFAGDVAARLGPERRLAVEGLDLPALNALRDRGLHLEDATGVFSEARLIKQPLEIAVMREAVTRVEAAAAALEAAMAPGASEVEVWSEFHRHLIATEGEYVSTRLFQSGPRTFPYFQEAGPRRMQSGDLVCFDTDALGYMHYAVDSRAPSCAETNRPVRRRRRSTGWRTTSCTTTPPSSGRASPSRASQSARGRFPPSTGGMATTASATASVSAGSFRMSRTTSRGSPTRSAGNSARAWSSASRATSAPKRRRRA